jgi:hypothetical protein
VATVIVAVPVHSTSVHEREYLTVHEGHAILKREVVKRTVGFGLASVNPLEMHPRGLRTVAPRIPFTVNDPRLAFVMSDDRSAFHRSNHFALKSHSGKRAFGDIGGVGARKDEDHREPRA